MIFFFEVEKRILLVKTPFLYSMEKIFQRFFKVETVDMLVKDDFEASEVVTLREIAAVSFLQLHMCFNFDPLLLIFFQ